MEPSELKRSCSNMTDKELEKFTAINEQNYEICKSILENRFAKKNNTFVFLIGTTHDQSELGFMLFIDSFFKNNKHVILEPLIRRINEKVIEYGYITLG